MCVCICMYLYISALARTIERGSFGVFLAQLRRPITITHFRVLMSLLAADFEPLPPLAPWDGLVIILWLSAAFIAWTSQEPTNNGGPATPSVL